MGGPHPLTLREREILESLCSGLTAREVGERLGLTVGGVSARRSRIYQKLGAQNLDSACQAIGVTAGQPFAEPPSTDQLSGSWSGSNGRRLSE